MPIHALLRADGARSCWALGLALLPLLAWDASGLDLWVMRQLADAAGFQWRERWLTAQCMHQGGRLLSWLVMGFIVGVNLMPGRWLPLLQRQERLQWLLATLLCLALVALVKRASLTSCPWDLREFGGTARYVSHWAFGLADGGGGRCFPSGHASAAFAFLAGAWALRRAYPRAARAWVAGVFLLGLAYGASQVLRGAHYPSHVLWTGWICWATTSAFCRVTRSRLAVQTHPRVA